MKLFKNGKPSAQDLEKGLWVLGGLGLGAGLMYLFDPERGKHRRTVIRDKCAHAYHQTGDTIGSIGGACRDLGNRSYGLLAEATHLFKHNGVDDETLVERVRSQIGHAVSDASSIEVNANAEDGEIILNGSVPADELEALLSRAFKVRGVKHVQNHLKVYNSTTGGEHAAAASQG
ncbi:MAG: BON domain-containing protein [Blastocatellia bacterium]|nr:BON domain-containing protein [Blastocatellia bacterium]